MSILYVRETKELAGVNMSNEALLTGPNEDLDPCCEELVPWLSSLWKMASSTELVKTNLKWPFPSLETIAKKKVQSDLAANKSYQLKTKETVVGKEE